MRTAKTLIRLGGWWLKWLRKLVLVHRYHMDNKTLFIQLENEVKPFSDENENYGRRGSFRAVMGIFRAGLGAFGQ